MKTLLLFTGLAASILVIPLAVAAITGKLAPYSAKHPGNNTLQTPNGPIPKIAANFAPFEDSIGISWDHKDLHIESNGMPGHPIMRGIRTWAQRVPLPHDFTGTNAYKIPLIPKYTEEPTELVLTGPLAIAVNGIPIFHSLSQSGADTYLKGELDEWGGHCGRADDYHYHLAPVHLENQVGKGNPVAYALDGYPIYAADPERDKTLDECHGYMDDDGNYRYVGEMKPPYMMAGFRGEVDLARRPRGGSLRPMDAAGGKLHGATITDHQGTLADGYLLTYEIDGKPGTIEYKVKPSGGADFKQTSPGGKITETSYAPRKRGQKGKGKGKKKKPKNR